MGKPVSGRKSYPASPTDYQLMEEIGDGASATVYRAICIPFNEIVAVKCLDLDRCNSNLEDMRREAQTMSLIDHPNVIKAYCSFVVDRCLWVVMPFMAQGSCLHIMKVAYPDGFEEAVICSLLKETLKALDYLHKHGHIHRDVKAGNILLDSTGFVKLGDFGVSACMFDKGDRQRSRNTFVGTPCWMAPEVLQSGSGYDFKADIWSFGITALELAHGHAPFSKYPPMKVLLMTLQNAPPGLDYERDKRFSKSFKEMVAMCLVKDQSKRPTAEKLLKHSFFKNAKPPESTLKKLLVDLPPLWDRVKALQLKDAAELVMKKMPSAEQEAISQSEYKRGVSAWNFDIEDLKAQASVIRDDDELPGLREEDMEPRPAQKEKASPSSLSGKPAFRHEIVCSGSIGDASSSEGRHLNTGEKITLSKSAELDCGGPSEIQCLASKDEIGKNVGVGDVKIGESHALNDCDSGQPMPTSERGLREANDRSTPEKPLKHDAHKDSSLNGPMMLPRRASMNSLSAPIRSSGGYRDSVEDKSKANVVKVKGRFSVMSENVDVVKAATSKETGNVPVAASVLIPQLQNLFQQTAVQQDLIMNLINSLQQTAFADGKCSSQVPTFGIDTSNEAAPSERERQLLTKISDLQNRVLSLTDDLTTERAKYIHLQQQLNDLSTQEKFGNSNGDKTST
ncbi:serine/threonine-protein kinase BLUS1-like isoform X2 [Nymphaea colorata]|uniref:serine/threonine-protein kinase BLUS1-like isoform X2 n=1 Tax=Nymphaea colorata TaxID=210225 RepID=UPI00129E383C|nr:serine/threonine-protein kinase BLUS1-like isoform X2 [Nymphaea colorata]